MRYGSTADLYNWSLAFVEIKFRSRISTPILWFAILQAELTCFEKFNLESIVVCHILPHFLVDIFNHFEPLKWFKQVNRIA